MLSCTAHAAPQPHKRAKRRVFWLFRIRVLRVASAPHGQIWAVTASESDLIHFFGFVLK